MGIVSKRTTVFQPVNSPTADRVLHTKPLSNLEAAITALIGLREVI